ncbi:MAG TPA: magnesium chelatase [Ruminococcus sp.]|nr:magnesium chelatase [Ruminococcus sp.]HBN10914.1 magnesium chelatase [Ruminococcus sp.]HCR74040.1 magnesium chelatase [Ruminococcus sp.]
MNNRIKLISDNISKVIIGKDDTIRKVLNALICGGHVLIEDVPGVGKTQLVSALARSVDGKFNRIQMTPDIMPSDIVGFSMLNRSTDSFEYHEGAVMCNFLLADEINRASPKSQSSLLEVMEEFQVTIDGETRKLPEIFMVLATQNPVETYGTYHLPEAQMDRFFMKISMGYPDFSEEIKILEQNENNRQNDIIKPVVCLDDISELRSEAADVFVSDKIKKYIVDIISSTRKNDCLTLGASPRGSISLYKASKAEAFISGRKFVTPDDVKYCAPAVLSHRIILSPKGRSQYRNNTQKALEDILRTVDVPAE